MPIKHAKEQPANPYSKTHLLDVRIELSTPAVTFSNRKFSKTQQITVWFSNVFCSEYWTRLVLKLINGGSSPELALFRISHYKSVSQINISLPHSLSLTLSPLTLFLFRSYSSAGSPLLFCLFSISTIAGPAVLKMGSSN